LAAAGLDLIDVDGTVIDIRTSHSRRVDQMHRFELAQPVRAGRPELQEWFDPTSCWRETARSTSLAPGK